MSAQFIVRFRGQPVRFTYQAGKRIWEIVPRGMASIFISEADAWLAATQHKIRPEEAVEVQSLQKLQEAAR